MACGNGRNDCFTKRTTMKNSPSLITAVVAAVLGFAAVLVAGPAPQGITVTGKGRCTKCGTKESGICQNVVVVEAGRAKAVYYLVDNEVSERFHKQIGTATKAVTVKGTLQPNGNRLKLTATSFEIAD